MRIKILTCRFVLAPKLTRWEGSMVERMNKIDFVITWVDGEDPAWQQERARYAVGKGMDASACRYRDWDNLQYWFRGVEKYVPWVNQIYFVTWGHVPSWLNTNHKKIQIVKHEEFLPQEYLPTFNINAIELNLHRIQGLSEQFVFFNDDMFIIRQMWPEDFFKNGLPRDCCIETAVAQDDFNNPFAHILLNDAALVNMHYPKRKMIRKNWKKWFHPIYGVNVLRNVLMFPYGEFSGFKYTHMPSPFLKGTYQKLWKEEREILDSVCRNKFRTVFDLNQYVIKYWQYMEGMYEPQSLHVGGFYTLGRDDDKIQRTLRGQKKKMICINDDMCVKNFEKTKCDIIEAFETVFPEKSSYER